MSKHRVYSTVADLWVPVIIEHEDAVYWTDEVRSKWIEEMCRRVGRSAEVKSDKVAIPFYGSNPELKPLSYYFVLKVKWCGVELGDSSEIDISDRDEFGERVCEFIEDELDCSDEYQHVCIGEDEDWEIISEATTVDFVDDGGDD